MKAIGIDLGTTNSVMAIVDENDAEHKPRVLLTRTRERFTPSVVSSGPQGLLVGREAWNNAEVAPSDTVFSIKRLMGRSFDDSEVNPVRTSYPYSVVSADDPADRGVRVMIGGIKRTPEEISAMILHQMQEDAYRELDELIKYAVITVPAYFSEPQREATRKAGESAGLIVKKIIDEPTAAAIAFAVDRSDERHRVLVFDMGGGTLDVSVLIISDGEFTVKSYAGDMWLGGDDLDNAIVGMVVEWVKKNYGIDPSNDRNFRLLARRAAERAKCILSEKDQVDLSIPACFSLPGPGGAAGDVAMTLTRAAFETSIKDYVTRAFEVVDEALAKKGFAVDQMTAVLLVGGSTYIPLVREALAAKFGPDKLCYGVNPMEAVALGAAILADQLQGVACPKCKRLNKYEATQCQHCGASLSVARDVGGHLHEITDRNFGICVMEGGDQDVFSTIIPEGTPYPLEKPMRQRYIAVGRQITMPVYVGNELKASQNEYLGLVQLTLPDDVPARTPVWVEFNYDRHRILKVRVEVIGREELVYDAVPTRKTADPNRVKDEWQLALQNAIAFAERMTEGYSDFISDEESKTMEDAVKNARQALHDRNQVAGQAALDKLLHVVDSLQIASRLLLVDSLMPQVVPETAGWLAERSKRLKDAYREQNPITVKRLRLDLEERIMSIIKGLPESQSRSFRGLLEKWKEGER